MTRDPGKLHRTTKPDSDGVWNGFKTIGGLVVFFKCQIGDQQTSLDPKNVQR